MPRNKYILSREADNDLEKIFDYTLEEFGFNQAVKYLEEIEIASNSAILNTTQVKITAELENTGIQLNLNDPIEFEFKSSVTMYIESSF